MIDSLIPHLLTRIQEFTIERVADRDTLRQILEGDRLFTAYALAQLESPAFGLSQWWTTQTRAGLSLVCHSRAGLGDATLALGPPDGVTAILSIHPGQPQTFITAKPEHVSGLRRAYTLGGDRTMLRMHVDAERFRPVADATIRLQRRHLAALNRLYSSEGGPASYRFQHLEEGCYYGVLVEGRLVAAAGTHAISTKQEIAVVGNVFTHPDYRGSGYAVRATSAVTAELLTLCRDAVLSVDPHNRPALEAYRSIGYRPAGDIIEAAARRRSGAVSTGLRRLLATFRGRRQCAELVRRPVR